MYALCILLLRGSFEGYILNFKSPVPVNTSEFFLDLGSFNPLSDWLSPPGCENTDTYLDIPKSSFCSKAIVTLASGSSLILSKTDFLPSQGISHYPGLVIYVP